MTFSDKPRLEVQEVNIMLWWEDKTECSLYEGISNLEMLFFSHKRASYVEYNVCVSGFTVLCMRNLKINIFFEKLLSNVEI